MPEEIVANARLELNPTDLHAEDLLDEIHHQRELSQKAREAADRAQDQAESLRTELALRLEKIEDERRSILEEARSDAEAQTLDLQNELRELRRQLGRARQPLEALKIVEEKVAALEETSETPVERRIPQVGDTPLQRAPRLGDRVHLRTLNTKGVVTALSEEEAEVQVGMLRVRSRLTDLQPISASEPPVSPEPTPAAIYPSSLDTPSPGIELDLRGQRADEALEAMERFLDSAYLAGLPFVRIIHGKGTGKLRQAVRQALQGHPHVAKFEAGGDKEGGEGVTVARLRSI
jgi:DNA mismatch repair protein MutS2